MTGKHCIPALLASFLLGWIAPAAAQEPAATPAAVPEPPAVQAGAYFLTDFHTGAILAEKNPDRRVEPASITKVMTGLVVFREIAAGRIGLQDLVTISDNAWRESMGTSRMFLEPRTQVSVEDLLLGMIVQSGNDASIALAEYVAGSEETFASLMNQVAAELGMSGSHFTNSTGLPSPELYTTARDLALLAAAMIREFPEYYEWYAIDSYSYNGITQPNRNRLMRLDPSVDGIKTGWTESAGYCLLSSAEREGRRLIASVLDAPSERVRTQASQALLNYGYRFFETHRLFAARDPLATPRVWKSAPETTGVGVREDLFVTVPRGRYEALTAVMELNEPLVAPLDDDTAVGQVTVSLGEEVVARRELYPVADVPEGSLWQRFSDEVLLWFE